MAAISKQEYLKRYLSNSEGGKKKKRKKIPKTGSKRPTSIIVDDDIALKDVEVADAARETNEFEGDADEAPAVYEDDGVTKISLETFKKREEEQRTKWAPISQNSRSSPVGEAEQKSNCDSDNSPPRITNRRRQDTPDLSPQRGGLRESPDQSPPRKKQSKSPPPRRGGFRDSPDQSPPRKRQVRSSPRRSVKDLTSNSAGRRGHSPQADNSLPRSRRRRHDSGDSLPEQVHGHSPDLSPSRQRTSCSPDRSAVRRTRNDSPDLSPPQSGMNRDSDQSPPRKRTNSDSDQSPPRKRGSSDSDQSPPRKQNRTARSENVTQKRSAAEDKMSSG